MSPSLIRFRSRLFTILLLFAVCPSVLLTLLWAGTVSRAVPLVSVSSTRRLSVPVRAGPILPTPSTPGPRK